MSIENKKQILIETVYKKDIALGNVDASLKYMTDAEVNIYFSGYQAFLEFAQILKNN